MVAKTLYDKLWDEHVVRHDDNGTSLLYIDRQLVHEVTSPQAFEGLRLAGRKPWRVNANLATPDHNVPTTSRPNGIEDIVDPIARIQVETLDSNCSEFGLTEFGMDDIRQGIVHVVGPEQGATLPGMTIVCGDSHTSTHGAFAALAQGIGTSEELHPIQQSFIENGAVQCGFCSPGIVMTTKALLDENPRPADDDIKEALAGTFCRCTGYIKIMEAVKKVSQP